MTFRIGQGTDIHKTDPDRPLILGGISIPSSFGLQGHSDADVLLHAITDAVLGALALDDIGAHFPDTDANWKDADSGDLLRMIMHKVARMGWSVVNVDSTVLAERPKLRPHIQDMRVSIAELLQIAPEQVSVKATTGEGLGFVGREEGIMAQAVVLLQQQEAAA